MMDLQPMEEGSASVEVHLHPHLAPLEDKMFSGGIYLSLCACTHMTLLACSHPHGMYNVGASHPVQLPSSVDLGLIVSHSKSFMAIRLMAGLYHVSAPMWHWIALEVKLNMHNAHVCSPI